MEQVEKLAELIRDRNTIAERITTIINRPATIGHVGEYIASNIFNIQLHDSAAARASDGIFLDGPFTNQSVNIKFYAKQESLLSIRQDSLPDYFLVLAGPKSAAAPSIGESRLWNICHVYLFNAEELVAALKKRDVKFSEATSVAKQYWEEAEIFPKNNPIYSLTKAQIELLRMFS